MPRGVDGDSGGEIKKLVSIHVGDANSLAALRYQRIRACIAWRDNTVIGCYGGFGFRTREGAVYPGSYLLVQFIWLLMSGS